MEKGSEGNSSGGTASGNLILELASCEPGLSRFITREGDAERQQQTLWTGFCSKQSQQGNNSRLAQGLCC